jgi:pyruvate dehydrogenase E2 component (dihydrolipoamide acetyltransferase)
MFGIEDFDPVINPPQAAILGVGAATAEADGRRLLRLTLGCDHRVLTGAEGAEFLATVKAGLEEVGS